MSKEGSNTLTKEVSMSSKKQALWIVTRAVEWPMTYSIRSYVQEHMKCFISFCYYCLTAVCMYIFIGCILCNSSMLTKRLLIGV